MAKVKNSNTEVPKWFDGKIYDQGDTVVNPYSGVAIHLNNVELSVYDFIMGVVYSGVHNKNFDRARYWFCEVNSKAYMELLD
jgi:hypothetical protein